MSEPKLRIVILGLSITSSWGNGHATTYRALGRALGAAGHDVLFLERDVPWYRDSRDCIDPEGCRVGLYESLHDLREHWTEEVRTADAVIVGSYVPQGVSVGRWAQRTATGVVAFYDIDTPVTIAKLARGDEEYLSAELIPGYDLYLSFTGGPTLERLERTFGARAAVPLYCSVDPAAYRPKPNKERVWDLGYLGTYSVDRQPKVEQLLLEVAARMPERLFAVGGPGYPDTHRWPDNVAHRTHLPPGQHADFYNRQRYTLNVTRADMVEAGWSPSVRLFEAAACGTPILSDVWAGIETLFRPEEEILLVRHTRDVVRILVDVPEEERVAIGARARETVLRAHTATHRAAELVAYLRRVAEVGSAGVEPLVAGSLATAGLS